MASDPGSAIDDSFEPNSFAQSVASSNAPDPSTYNGPRSGHWSVRSSTGSAFDDRCPTVWSALPDTGTAAPRQAAMRPIERSLLKRLGQAAVEEQEAAEVTVRGHAEGEADVEQRHSARSEMAKPKQSAPKGFYVPKANNVRDTKAQPAVAKTQPEKKKYTGEAKKARASSPQPAAKPDRDHNIAPLVNTKLPRGIRIVGEDGQEAFVQLPHLPQISKSSPRSPTTVPETRPKGASKPETTTKSKPQTAKPSRDKSAKVAAEALMSGVLPAPKKQEAAAPKQSAKKPTSPAPDVCAAFGQSSQKDSAVGFGGLFESDSRPPSAVPSNAVSAKSLQEAVRNISRNSKRSESPSVPGSEAAGGAWASLEKASDGDFRPASQGWTRAKTPSDRGFQVGGGGWAEANTPSDRGFQAVGDGWTNAMMSPHQSSRPSGEAWAQPETLNSWSKHSPAWQKSPSTVGIRTRSSTHEHASKGSGFGFQEDLQDPTVFAGKGWISPHPLSRAPTPIASPPQSHISLPFTALHGREMSYEEWKAVQEGQVEHKHFSRAESVVSSRVLAVAGSIVRGGSRQGSVRGSMVGSQGYQNATVESEHGSQRSGCHKSQQRQSEGSGSQHSARRSQASGKPASKANGWDALPAIGFDSTSDGRSSSAGVDEEAYRTYLDGIISDPTQRTPLAEALRVHLPMPWDRQPGHRGRQAGQPPPARSVKSSNGSRLTHCSSRPSHMPQSEDDTPPSNVFEAHARSRINGPPYTANPAASQYRNTNTADFLPHTSWNGDSAVGLDHSASPAVSEGLWQLDEAERGYGGW